MVLEKTPESPLDSKEIKPVDPKGNQPWISTGRTDAEVEAPILGHLMRRTDSLEKTLVLGKIEGRRRRGRQSIMFGWHHRLDGHDTETLRAAVLRSQRVRLDWATELNWQLNPSDLYCLVFVLKVSGQGFRIIETIVVCSCFSTAKKPNTGAMVIWEAIF